MVVGCRLFSVAVPAKPDKSGKKFEVIEVVGKWDDGTAQKVTADAIAIHKHFVGIYTQGGSTGRAVRK